MAVPVLGQSLFQVVVVVLCRGCGKQKNSDTLLAPQEPLCASCDNVCAPIRMKFTQSSQ